MGIQDWLLLTKKYSQNLKVESYFIWWEWLGLWVRVTTSEKIAPRRQEGESDYICLQQREQAAWTSKIRYQVKEFSILCTGRRKPLVSLNLFLSFAPQLSGANPVSLFTLFLAFLHLLSKHCWGWQLDLSLGSPHPHLEARNRWWLWHFLFIDMAGDVFISQSLSMVINLTIFWRHFMTLFCVSRYWKSHPRSQIRGRSLTNHSRC